MHKFAEQCPKNKPIVFVVGGVSTGDPGNTKYNFLAMEVDYIDDSICVSKYPLSASVALGRIINAFEDLWEIC
jgi:rRNA pseudouridine-1189 N-methylase Emg1 (Nep1/Mra1 family)